MTSFELEQEERAVGQLESKLKLLRDTVSREEDALEKATLRLKHTQDAQAILQHLAQAVQQQAHQRISEVVSSCLAAVFDDPYELKINFERKRGRTEAHLRFVRRGLDVSPVDAAGGGMVDVAAFALRVACLVLCRPRLSRIIVLDEPFKFVSAQYQDNVRSMLEELSEKMDIQIIQVTHNEAYATGKLITL